MSYEIIKLKNSHLEFLNENNSELKKYGQFITIPGIHLLLEQAESHVVVSREQNTYVASDPILDTAANRNLFSCYFGGIEIQIGWVAGPNSTMNGMEYHKSNEILVALTEQVLLLGLQTDLDENYKFITSKAKALHLDRGDCFELFPQTLHLSPCKTSDSGFKSLIILPKGTNLPFDKDDSQSSEHQYSINNSASLENPEHHGKSSMAGNHVMAEADLLFMKNKWLLAHPERKQLIDKGAFPGLVGENVRVLY